MKKPFAQFDSTTFAEAIRDVPTLVGAAIKRIQDAPFDLDNAYVGHSGGKDSVLVRYLTDLARPAGSGQPEIPTVHSTKPPGVPNEVHELTRLFLYGQDRIITYAPLEHMKDLGYTVQIDGTRRSEFDRTNGRAVDVVIEGQQVSRENMPMYIDDGLFGLSFIYPIVDWTDAQVWAAIYLYDIPFSDEYLV